MWTNGVHINEINDLRSNANMWQQCVMGIMDADEHHFSKLALCV